MESPAININCHTSWTVAAGSLEDSITFESSISLINNDQSTTTVAAVDSPAPKSPLILYPTSPDHSTPCEITITFQQKQELRQVYVRSSARVYELFCASEFNSGNEYLCTVRCGIAARDEEVLRAVVDIEEIASACQKSTVKELAEERLGNSSNVTTSEDDWVEVKVVDPPVSESSSFESKSDAGQRRSSYSLDLYEATAEISDANPCKSITLRLLSLQNKDCVCIDEVYVFADPVDEADVDNKAASMESSAGSSLMAMLMPTFLQLSRTKGFSTEQDKQNTNRMNGQKLEEIEAKPSDPIDTGNESPPEEDVVQLEGKSGSSFQQEVQSQEEGTPIAKPGQPETPLQVSDIESKSDISHNRIEGVLNQLVSRVSRIEDFCSRFEDCMLKPIRSIDERLQRVEQQLEVLTKRTQYSGLLSCTRISAPEFSCSESETNSLYNSGCADLTYAACETNKKDSLASLSSIHSDATPVSETMTKAYPSLVVAASEFPNFPNCDNDEEDDAVEPAKESPKKAQKFATSVDDALASALAGFVSSVSVQSPRYSKVLAVKAPDFPNEDINSNGETASPTGSCQRLVEPSTCEPQGMEHLRSSISSLSGIALLDNDEKMTRLSDTINCAKTGGEGVERSQDGEGDEGNPRRIYVHLTTPSMHDMTRTDSYQVIDDTSNGEVGNGRSDTKAIEKPENLEQLSGYQTDDGANTTLEFTVLNKQDTCTEVAEEGLHQEILQNAVELSHASAKLDFETPIWEVKFTSQDNLNASSPLEALLAGITGLYHEEAHSRASKDEAQTGYQSSDLIVLDDLRSVSSTTDNIISLDTDYYSLPRLPLIAEDATHLKND